MIHERLEHLDLDDSRVVADLFERAARANLRHRRRKGATVHLPGRGRLVISGDLHDNEENFLRLIALADLSSSRYNHLVLHEVIHGDEIAGGRDFSVQMLAKTAALKLSFPGQVHLMMGNHELAQLAREDIYKGNVALVDAFAEGLNELYGVAAESVRQAMHLFIRSLLLAVKCANGIFCSHSLPGAEHIDRFDPSVIHRMPEDVDLSIGGSAYNLLWGRDHGPEVLRRLAKTWAVDVFVIGHEPADRGYLAPFDDLLILASDHENGAALPIRLSRSYGMEELVEEIVPLRSVTLSG